MLLFVQSGNPDTLRLVREREIPIRVTFSRDMAYIYVRDDAEVARSIRVEDHPKGDINLDFDLKNRLVGIEVIGATRVLPEGLLKKVKRS